ncbi:MAG: DUF4129 domain-containing protein [Cyanobacteria bacterium J06560_6]
MSDAAYRTNSFWWQTRKLLSRFNQWLEYRDDQAEPRPDRDFSQWSLPEEVAQVLFWIIVTVLCVWLASLLYKALEPAIREWWESEQRWVKLGGNKTPAAEEHSVSYWMQMAQEQAKQGKYKEACRALYRATLQQLHDTKTLLHDPSRTDGEYLKRLGERLGRRRSLPRPYQLLIGTHERLVFGSAIATAEMFKRCRRAYEEVTKEAAKIEPDKPEATNS